MIDLSIVIVNYKVKKELFVCLKSIYDSKPTVSFEIIVVDNDEEGEILPELHRKFPKIIYLKNKNKGFGQASNVGAERAKGNYLFFLNPDTKLIGNAIDPLIKYIRSNKNAGVVAPLLMDKENKPFKLQGLGALTPLSAIFSLSFLNKIFPKNPISKKYWNLDWDKKSVAFVESVPGTAFVIRKSLFEKIGGFDENFFLYFEEHDLFKRVKDLSYKVVMLPSAKAYHAWGSSTKKSNLDIDKIFRKSRFHYFRNHFGLMKALFVELILRINSKSIILYGILILSLFLNTFQLDKYTSFFGDVGWYFVSARDIITSHNIPLIGIASSHPWIHQGAFWTYILAPLLVIGRFNPLIAAYFSALLGVVSVFLIYKVSKELFSQKVGLLASFFYATSPAIIYDTRTPYHTTPIPFFAVLLLYSVYLWIRKGPRYFPFVIFLLAVLYNFEIATFSLTASIILILIYGLIKKMDWARKLLNRKRIVLSIFAFLVPMSPMILYDISHGFPQTLRFIVWIFYKIAVVFGYPPLHPEISTETWATFFPYLFTSIKTLIFYNSLPFALILIGVSVGYVGFKSISHFRKKKLSNYGIVFVLFIIPAISYIAAKTNSAAYFFMFYPQTAIIIALFFNGLSKNKYLKVPAIALLLLVGFLNAYALVSRNYFPYITYSQRLENARQIVREADGNMYNIVGRGQGSQYESFTEPYEYLTWWLGNGPSGNNQKLKFYVREYPGRIVLERKE